MLQPFNEVALSRPKRRQAPGTYMMGGPSQVEHLEKVKAVEHLLFLSQLTELEPYSLSDF